MPTKPIMKVKAMTIRKAGLTFVQVIFLTAGIALWQTLFTFTEDADTRFVMNLGRYILENGFPHVEPFTIHENLQLVAQQWLSGIFFWLAYENFGLNGLLVLDYLFGAAAILIYWRLCLLVGENKILSLAMAFVVGLLIASSIVPRPHIFSTPFLVAEVFFLEKFTRTGKEKFLLPLPLVSVALINFHAAVWAMSLVLCLPFLFVKNLRHIKFLLAAILGIFFCGLINPYGLDAMTYVLRSYGVDLINSNIAEMFTPSAHRFEGKIFYFCAAFVIFTLGRFKIPCRYIFLSGGLIFMAVMHWRNVLLFYLTGTLPLAYAWRNFSPEKFFALKTDEQYKNRGLMTVAFFLMLFVNIATITFLLNDLDKLSAPIKIFFLATTLFALIILLFLKSEGRILHPAILPRKNLFLLVSGLIFCGILFTTLNDTRKSPPMTYSQAIEFLLRTEKPENISLYVPQGIGGLAGSYGIKYYIDSRSEVFLDANNGRKNIFKEYLDFTSGKIPYDDFFARYNFTHIILTSEKTFLFDALSRDKNFRVIYESERVDGYDVLRCKIFVPKSEV